MIALSLSRNSGRPCSSTAGLLRARLVLWSPHGRADREDIDRALRAAARGQALLDPAVHARLVTLVARQHRAAPTDQLPDGLTARETEVLGCMARGLSNRDIARSLVVSEATVKTHINRIFAKTGSPGRGQAIAYAHRHGLG